MEFRFRLHVLIVVCLWVSVVAPVRATTFATVPDVLKRLHHGNYELKEKHAYLTSAQVKGLKNHVGKDVAVASMYTYFEIWKNHTLESVALIDTHPVRTMNESVLISLNKEGKVEDISVLSFSEPKQYLPQKEWLSQFRQKEAADTKHLSGITGATLSSLAIQRSVQTALFLNQEGSFAWKATK